MGCGSSMPKAASGSSVSGAHGLRPAGTPGSPAVDEEPNQIEPNRNGVQMSKFRERRGSRELTADELARAQANDTTVASASSSSSSSSSSPPRAAAHADQAADASGNSSAWGVAQPEWEAIYQDHGAALIVTPRRTADADAVEHADAMEDAPEAQTPSFRRPEFRKRRLSKEYSVPEQSSGLHVAREMGEEEPPPSSSGAGADGGTGSSAASRRVLSALTSGEHVGCFSCHGVEPSMFSRGSVAKINQDCACVVCPVGKDASAALFCVYDGHGKFGTEVSTQVMHSLRHALTDDSSALPFGEAASAAAAFGSGAASLETDPTAALVGAFEAVQAQLSAFANMKTPSEQANESGACATVAFLRDGILWVAGAGDCTCVLGSTVEGTEPRWVAKQLTTDHKCDSPIEKARIESLGGWVCPAEYEDGELVAPARMFEDQNNRMKGPGLAMSRCLGDLEAMKVWPVPQRPPLPPLPFSRSPLLSLVIFRLAVWPDSDS